MSNAVKKKPNKNQLSFLSPTLREQLNSKQELYLLSEQINWIYFEDEFGPLYSNQETTSASDTFDGITADIKSTLQFIS